MPKTFWIEREIKKSYQDLVDDVNQLQEVSGYIYQQNGYNVFVRIVHSLLNDYPIVLFDGDFSESEFSELSKGLSNFEKVKIRANQNYSLAALGKLSENLKNWSIMLFTSGTTGLPKLISHNFASITKAVKISEDHKKDVWAFAYNPTHMAGIQVFFQALLNHNTLVNVFKKSSDEIKHLLQEYRVTHISATPTFYRLMLDGKTSFANVKQISSGGEKLNDKLKAKLKLAFPGAKLRNIYASTEIGSLFASQGEDFIIPERLGKYVKIKNNQLLVHKDIIGQSASIQFKDGWYYTGDIVELKEETSVTKFSFSHRENEMINVGGYKVNPNEVELEIQKIVGVKAARVYGKKNSVLGNILCADVVSVNLKEKAIREILAKSLQNFKIPRMINFVNEMKLTRTGKLPR
ncbi:MAG: fatty acid--CoA ligase family protein [Pseudomonadota bacterium]|nr:fatty acid--CoA ligase family protein [Pseudomonadota bacterium]